MASGGARTRSGPAPDPNALRRDRDKPGDWLLLPVEGRPGVPPAWPFEFVTDRELVVWARLWRKPQAVAWERFDLVDQVALYCRRWCEAEVPESAVALSTLIRQQENELGIPVAAMHTLRWKIAEDETAKRRTTPAPKRSSSRDRLKVVDSDGA